VGTHWRKSSVEIRNRFEFSRFTLGGGKQDAFVSRDRPAHCEMLLRLCVTDLRAQDKQEKALSENPQSQLFHSSDVNEDWPGIGQAPEIAPEPVPSLARALAWNLLLFVGLPALLFIALFWLTWK